MAEMVFQYTPNTRIAHYTTSETDWKVIGINPTTLAITSYDSLSDLDAAGDRRFPGLDAGIPAPSVTVKSENGAAADGSAFYVAVNRADAPTEDTALLVSGSGQAFVIPTVHNIWIKKTTAADEIMLMAQW